MYFFEFLLVLINKNIKSMKKLTLSFIEKQTLNSEELDKIKGGDCWSVNKGSGDCHSYNWGKGGDCLRDNYGGGECGSNKVVDKPSLQS